MKVVQGLLGIGYGIIYDHESYLQLIKSEEITYKGENLKLGSSFFSYFFGVLKAVLVSLREIGVSGKLESFTPSKTEKDGLQKQREELELILLGGFNHIFKNVVGRSNSQESISFFSIFAELSEENLKHGDWKDLYKKVIQKIEVLLLNCEQGSDKLLEVFYRLRSVSQGDYLDKF